MTKKDEEQKKEQEPVVKKVKLSTDWCLKKELGTVQDTVPYTDFSKKPPESYELELDIDVIPASKKATLRAIAGKDTEDTMEIQTKYEELLISTSLGIDLADIKALLENKPVGLWDNITLAVSKAQSSFGSIAQQDAEDLKNSEGQEK